MGRVTMARIKTIKTCAGQSPRTMMLTIAMLFGGATAIAVPIAQDESTIILPGGDGLVYSDEYISGFLSYIYLTPV